VDLDSECGSGYRKFKNDPRAEGFSCSLDVLYKGLGISKFKFLIKKVSNKFFSCKFFSILGHKKPGSGLDPDRYSATNAGPGSGLNESGSETLY
jgi:hypothetical protein